MNNITHKCSEPGGVCDHLDLAVARLTRILSHPDVAAAVAVGIEEEGDAFGAFVLTADGVDVTERDELQEQFNARHVGTYDSLHELRNAYLDQTYWQSALAYLQDSDRELLIDFLLWDGEESRSFLHQRYEIHQTAEELFVFEHPTPELDS